MSQDQQGYPVQVFPPLLLASHCPPDLASSCLFPVGSASRETSSVPAWIRILAGSFQATAETCQVKSTCDSTHSCENTHHTSTQALSLLLQLATAP